MIRYDNSTMILLAQLFRAFFAIASRPEIFSVMIYAKMHQIAWGCK